MKIQNFDLSIMLHLKTYIRYILIFSSLQVCAQTYYTDSQELVDAVNNSVNGGTFIVKNGIYNDFETTFKKIASADNPIVIKAETLGGVLLTGSSHFVFKKSAYITLDGFVIAGQGEETLVKLEGKNHIRISRNVCELET